MDIPQCLKGIWSPARVITTPEDVIQRMECHWGYNNSGVGDHRLATVRSAFISFLRGTGYPKGEGEQLRVHGLYDPSKVAGDVGFRARLLWHALTGSPLLPLADNEKMTVRAGVMCALQCAIKVGTCARSLEFCWCATMQSWFVENGSVPDAGPRRDSFDDFFIVQLLCQVVATGGFSRA
ncbi:hypothetical protein BOTBODRAFT_288201 [Botryobasidium botryosum FD-172 SS1]|uniref:Uncharacterized protein n=1 Tax=Botryobasidium botryosum (strain FD-172 SS1) TaxID=930990 RepID=A0A067LUH6_BOTB1|nr:hypothetical protein BOTBODRAFT_288201 [Botryobasidium botryosum FD-172 SS1]